MQQLNEQMTGSPPGGGVGQDDLFDGEMLGGPNLIPPQNQFETINRHTPDTVINGTVLPAVKPKVEYTPDIPDKMMEFFTATEPTRIVVDVLTWKSGEIREVEREVPNPPPNFSSFARQIGVTTRMLKSWIKKYPDFKDAYEECQQIIKEFIIENGLTGRYSGAFAIFAAKNLTDMKDKAIVERRSVDMNKLLDQLEKGELLDEGSFQENF